MSSETTTEFESSLSALGVTRVRTTSQTFKHDLRDAIREPAVGTPLSIHGISLADVPVTIHSTPRQLNAANTGVTTAEFAVASYGTVVLEDTPDGSDPVSLFPDRHVVLVRESDILDTMASAFEHLGPLIRERRRSEILATGPSATADMGSLVTGVHGPEEVHVLIITDR